MEATETASEDDGYAAVQPVDRKNTEAEQRLLDYLAEGEDNSSTLEDLRMSKFPAKMKQTCLPI